MIRLQVYNHHDPAAAIALVFSFCAGIEVMGKITGRTA
jgi:hypothetical protein